MTPAPKTEIKKTTAGKKLSYKDQRELELLPARTEQLDQEQTQLQASLADPELYRRDAAAFKKLSVRTKEVEAELAEFYMRWEHWKPCGSAVIRNVRWSPGHAR